MRSIIINKKTWLLCTIIAIPFMVTIAANLIYTVNMPNWDDYDSVLNWIHDFLTAENSYEKLRLLFSQHNEHRILVDRLIILAQYTISGRVDFYVLNVVGLLALLSLTSYFITMACEDRKISIAALPVPYILLSFSAYGLISFAMASMQAYWQMLFSVLAIVAASKAALRYSFLAVASASLAAFSGAAGLLVFPAILVLQIVRRDKLRVVLWLFVTGFVGWFYFVFLHYQAPMIGMQKGGIFQHNLLELVWYAFAFLGNFAGALPGGLLISGLVGLTLCVFLFMFLKARSGFNDDVAYTIALLMILTAGSAAISRFSEGFDSALSSRYTIYSTIFACAIYLIYVRRAQTPRATTRRTLMAAFFSLIIYVSWAPIAVRQLTNQRTRLLTSIVYPEELRAAKILTDAIATRTFFPIVVLPVYLPVDESSHVPLILPPGESIDLQFTPRNQFLPNPRRLTDVGLFVGNYGGSSDGDLLIRACARKICSDGAISLKGGADNAYALVPFHGKGLEIASDDHVEILVRHVGGSVPIAIWMYPSLSTSDVILKSTSVPFGTDRIPKISLKLK